METQPLIMERTYNATAARVWDAITDSSKMREWYFDIKSFKPEVGFNFSFLCVMDGMDYLHLCEVTEVVPGKKLTHSWRYDGFEGNSFVTFELFPEGNTTRLVLTHRGIESFPASAEFTRGSFTEGWTEILGKSLKDYVEGVEA